MRSGSAYGGSERRLAAPALSVFRDNEDGFTTVAVALALLLSLTLVFSSAAAGRVASRSSEVQRVADAAAMAGDNAVAAFSTVVQVIDACVLSLGMAGIVTYGAGIVASCVPGLSSVGAQLCSVGGQVLEARRTFSRSAAAGIERLESALPLLVVANSASCVSANSAGGLSYVGCALPLPVTSQSDFSMLDEEVEDDSLEELSEQMRQASSAAQEARLRADDALERGWMADCGSSPYCLWERASKLAGLSSASNAYYASPAGWSFGAPLLRARAYYAARLVAEAPAGGDAGELTNSACRSAFYAYALEQVRGGFYAEGADGTVVVDLPSLPRNTDEMRETSLYTQQTWPCTLEEGVRTLHSSRACPGASGEASGTASLAQLEAGGVARCETCHMDAGDLGRVGSASSAINNGFEYHWRIIVEASEDYERARADLAAAESETRGLAERGEESFSEAIEQLSSARPTLCPPGSWGCVSVVYRAGGNVVPTELTQAFLSSAELPAGAAVSAAALAPDESTTQNNVLSSFFDGLASSGSLLGGAADGVLELWGSLLVGYGSTYGAVADAGGAFLDGVDNVLGGTVGSWLKEQLKGVMRDTGMEPVDMRLRKPVLVNSQDVLSRAGLEQLDMVRELVTRLPDSPSVYDFARALGVTLADNLGGGGFTVAELSIPGTSLSIPLTIDLSELGDVA